MKTFVVTGASGYIGSHMCYELRQKYPDCIIVGVDKVQKNKLKHLYDDFMCYDLAKTNACVFDRYKADCVFHFAAYASVPEGEEKPFSYYYNNLMSSMRILDEAIYHGIKNFIFSSSCAVYGRPDYHGEPVDEYAYEMPESVYANTKYMFEQILEAAQKEHKINAGILRYFNAAGRNVEAGLYEEHNPETHLIPNLMKNKVVEVYGNEYPTRDGTAIRDYIHVIDICKAHIKAYEYMRDNDQGILCNIGTGKGYSVLEVIAEVQKITGLKEIKFHAPRDGDVPELYSDVSRMRNDLQFTPEHDIVSIIESMRN
jgi:UDP-glucose 4-epimerase